MLKLITNEVPTGDIDGINTTYTLSAYIGYIQNIIVDGLDVGGEYTFLHDTITLNVAPTASITVSFFSREERNIMGNGEVTMGDLIDEVYDELGRKQYTKIYPKEKIRRDLNKTIGIILDDTPERSHIQHYSFKGLNGLTVVKDQNTVSLTTEESYPLDIAGSFLVGDGIYYNYYDYDGQVFEVAGNDLIDDFDKIIVGHRIPYGVEKISEVYVDGYKLEYIDNRDFYMDTMDRFTIIRDYQGNDYLYLPYRNKEYTCVVKYIPDYTVSTHDEDVLNIPYKYTRVPVYNVVYKLLASREDDRWQYYKQEFTEEYDKYKGFKAKATRKTKGKIGFADTYGDRDRIRYFNPIPDGVYDEYL